MEWFLENKILKIRWETRVELCDFYCKLKYCLAWHTGWINLIMLLLQVKQSQFQSWYLSTCADGLFQIFFFLKLFSTLQRAAAWAETWVQICDLICTARWVKSISTDKSTLQCFQEDEQTNQGPNLAGRRDRWCSGTGTEVEDVHTHPRTCWVADHTLSVAAFSDRSPHAEIPQLHLRPN